MSIEAVTWAFRQRIDDPTAKLVLLGIADKYNEDRGYAWPSIARLAEMADCTERTVTRKIAYLAEIGLVEIMRNPPASNHYYLPTLTNCHPDTRDRVTLTPDVRVTLTPDVTLTIDNNNINNKDMINDAFKRFWDAVPKKVAKKASITAFKRALKDTDADTLINGMAAYAKMVRDKGVKKDYILHPTTWLNQGRWEDEAVQEGDEVHYFGVANRWTPKTREEWDKRVTPENGDFWLKHWKYHRPDLLTLAKQKGWIDDEGRPTAHT